MLLFILCKQPHSASETTQIQDTIASIRDVEQKPNQTKEKLVAVSPQSYKDTSATIQLKLWYN